MTKENESSLVYLKVLGRWVSNSCGQNVKRENEMSKK